MAVLLLGIRCREVLEPHLDLHARYHGGCEPLPLLGQRLRLSDLDKARCLGDEALGGRPQRIFFEPQHAESPLPLAEGMKFSFQPVNDLGGSRRRTRTAALLDEGIESAGGLDPRDGFAEAVDLGRGILPLSRRPTPGGSGATGIERKIIFFSSSYFSSSYFSSTC